MIQFKRALMTFLILSIIGGIVYPLIVTVIAQGLFNYQANGSLLNIHDKIIGSSLIGQEFTSDKYLWSRPSATSNYPYNPLASGGSNLSPSSNDLFHQVKDRTILLGATSINQVPIDLVTASASGLDPEISLAAAYFQVPRIARARGLSKEKVKAIIDQYARYPLLGIWGEARVNVLSVNLMLEFVK